MNVLILGSGGREHAFAWKIAQSELLTKLYVAPGNAGTEKIAQNISLDILDFASVAKFIEESEIDLLIIGPEEPLVNGIVDYFNELPGFGNLLIIGPDKLGAMLEGSKDFAKIFMQKHDIPTAKYFCARTENITEAISFLTELKPPFVLKADGLAAGKGVLIIDDLEVAKLELKSMLDGKFGKASAKVVIEEYLQGIECSVFVLTDGISYKILPEAKDYKRIGEKDTGLNTGGMGAVSPVPFYDEIFKAKVEERIIKPTIHGINKENMNYKGFVFFGLMNVDGNPYVIEYNVRMGDPETEVVIPRIESDFLHLLISAAKLELNKSSLKIDTRAVSTVMLVSGGYPECYEKGKVISGIEKVIESIIFHAGTTMNDGNIISAGGRVLAVSSYGENIFSALKSSYDSAKLVNFDKMYFRKDIGFDLK
jgi:phosphoribosylamine--glycine ligase